MQVNALAVANCFVDLANKDGKELRLLGLVKRVYLAHGFSLAIYGKSLLDPRFDRVEAWKYGPVIPSVYHSFKQNKNNPIHEKADVMEYDKKGNLIFLPATLEDEKTKKLITAVWKRYYNKTDNELVTILHQRGTPWHLCYVEGQNKEIPNDLTAGYYLLLMDRLKEAANARRNQ